MRRNIAEEADRFFKEMGLEEEMAKLTEVFTDNFMVKGDETEDLKEVLHRASDSLLDMIWENITGEGPDEGISRQQKEESLYEDIPGYFESRFELLDIRKIRLLIRVMNYDSIDIMESKEVMEEFVPYGWVFSFVKDQSSSFVVMKELRDIIMTLDDPEVKKRVSFMNGIRAIVNVCLGLYGVCTIEQIRDIFRKAVFDEDRTEEETGHLDEILQEYFPYLEEQRELWVDGKYIISPYLSTKEEYKALLRIQKKDYYVPDDELIKVYGLGGTLVKNKEYEAVFKLLSREIKDQKQAEEMLEELCGYVIREDWEVTQIMNCLYNWDVVFSSEKAAGRMVSALDGWLAVIRRWSECGHSRKEIYGQKTISFSGRQSRNFQTAFHANSDGVAKDAS